MGISRIYWYVYMLIYNLLLPVLGVLVVRKEKKSKSWSEKQGVRGRGMKKE